MSLLGKRRGIVLGTVALVAPSGATIQLLGKPDTSLGSLFSLAQGGALTTEDKSLEEKVLSLEGEKVSQTVREPKERKTLTLEDSSTPLSLAGKESLGLEASGKDTRELYKELKKEGETLSVKGKVEGALASSKKTLKSYANLFKAAHRIIKGSSKPSTQTRGKREIPEENQLNLQQRKSMWYFLKEWAELSSKKSTFSTELSRAVEEKPSVGKASSFNKTGITNILNALTTMGWNVREDLTKENTPRRRGRAEPSGNTEWGDWATKNPFRYFFSDESTWRSYLNSLSAAEKALETYLTSKRTSGLFISTFFGADAMNNWVYSELGAMKEAVKNAKSGLEVQIGKTILEKMGQTTT